MAASVSKSKNNRGKKNSRPAARNRKNDAASGRTESNGIGREIALCVILAFSVLLVLSNFGIVGRYGNVMSDALFGTFGLMEYVFPFALFFGAAFFMANRKNSQIWRKMFGVVLMFLFLDAFLQLLTMGYAKGTPLTEIYRLSMEERNGGGIVGGAIAGVFGYAFGAAGAYVLTVFGLIAAAIIMTQKPLLTDIGKKGRSAAVQARERRSIRQSEREEDRKERAKEKEALSKLKKTEKQLAREQRIRRIEDETLSKERQRERERIRSTGVSYRETIQSVEKSPLDAVTLDRPVPGNIKQIDPSEKETKTSAPEIEPTDSGRHEEEFPRIISPDTPKLQEPAYEMPSFLKNAGSEGSIFGLYGNYDQEEDEPLASSADTDEITANDRVPETGNEEIPEDGTERAAKGRKRRTAKASGAEEPETAAPVSVDEIKSEIGEQKSGKPVYTLPPLELLSKGKAAKTDSEKTLMSTAAKLQQTLEDFGVNVKVVNVSRGPTVTRYELQPEHGVKVSRIINLQDDIKLNLATSEIRIEAPIPGKAAVGIEVPNREIAPVMLREIIDCPEYKNSKAVLAFAVGKDIGGRPVITDIEKMPHLLIAGATGSGKSVCINTLIMSILYKATPDQVKMLMIDPKVVELKIYDGIPHLLIPVVTDARKAAGALNWAVQEMTERYNKFASYPGVRDIRSYNERIRKMNAGLEEADRIPSMPRIVVIVDELADLMMVASGEVEDAICRLAQLARAAGIHLIIATQRPSVNVVTGLIKANMPSRIALAVTSGIDSRTILDMNGAEKLLGKGDMLFYPQGYPKPARVQGAYVSDEDITKVVDYLAAQSGNSLYNTDIEEKISNMSSPSAQAAGGDDERDEYFADSGRLIIEKEKASIGMLQRAFKIGFNRAARIMDQLSEAGVVGGEEGTKPRKILMTADEFEQLLSSGGSEDT